MMVYPQLSTKRRISLGVLLLCGLWASLEQSMEIKMTQLTNGIANVVFESGGKNKTHQPTDGGGIEEDDGILLPTDEDDVDDGIPRHLRLLLVGDSVTRYQYLSLVYYLRHGQWEPIKVTADHPRHIICEREYNSWEVFFSETNEILAPYEWCDCYRTDSTGGGDITEVRYYHDPRYDNYVYFVPKFGPASIKGVWEPENLPLATPSDTAENGDDADNKSMYNPQVQLRNTSHFVLPNWEYQWSNLGDFVSRIKNRASTTMTNNMTTLKAPTHVILNGGLWPTDWEIRDEDSQDKLIQSLRLANVTIIYKTTTAKRNVSATWDSNVDGEETIDIMAQAHNYSIESQLRQKLGPLEPYEERLCSMADHCLDLRWTSKVPPHFYWDAVHFFEPVYQWINFDLLALLMGNSSRTNILPSTV